MKKININDGINNISDELIDKAIKIDSKEKLDEIRKKEKKTGINIIKYLSLAVAGAFIFMITIIPNNNNNIDQKEQIPTPLMEYESLEKLEHAYGRKITILKNKKVDAYILYNFDEESNPLAEIRYSDDSYYRVQKNIGDISGIYGATLIESKKIKNAEVSIYEFEDTKYATWTIKDYSYAYVTDKTENIEMYLNELIEGEK